VRGKRPIPIGGPTSNLRCHVLDRRQQPVALGVVGELFLGGVGLARGYWRRPALSAEKFVPDTLGGEPGQRLYRTGDRVRSSRDGTIEFLGRVDFQVKLRGLRVEPGEIEAVLQAHPAIREAVILTLGQGGAMSLAAYVVVTEPGPSEDELRTWLRERLPDYMVPRDLVILAALPLNPNGKVDRAALAAIPLARSESEEEGQRAPRRPSEQVMAELWSQLLQVDPVAMDDNFFELGGHSLLATQLLARVRRVFRAELPLRQLFEEPSAAGLVAQIVRLRGEEVADEIARTFQLVQRLSDDEVAELLAELR
jgi:acyl carrier protein